jgi:hypothetical protein
MNYYLDERVLQLKEQNIYTAIEVATLIPVQGDGINNFLRENRWVLNWFPSISFPSPQIKKKEKYSLSMKRITEFFLNSNRLDNLLMHITAGRWKKKMLLGATNQEGMPMNLQVNKHYARSNPGNFQERLLIKYENLLKKFTEVRKVEPVSSSG